MVQTEAVKISKAKYYKTKSESEEFRKQNAEKMHIYYQNNREKHIEAVKRCQQRKKDEHDRLLNLVNGLGLV